MKILFVLHSFDQAGSQSSLLAQAETLRGLGHEILFVGAKGPFQSVLAERGVDFVNRPYHPFSPLALPGFLRLLATIRRWRPDVLVSSNYWPHIECTAAMAVLGVPVASIFSGGVLSDKPILPVVPIISYSSEMRDAMVAMHGFHPDDIHVVRNRIDFSRLRASEQAFLLSDTKPASGGRSFLLVGRLDQDKMPSVRTFLETLGRLAERESVTGGILGGGSMEASVQAMVRELNRRIGRETVIMHGHRADPVPYMLLSDFVAALGRSAMEAMALGRPTMVPCRDGSMSLVTPDNAERHSYFNFGGRMERDATERAMDDLCLMRAMDDSLYRRQLGTDAKDFIREHYDVRGAASRLSEILAKAFRTVERDAAKRRRLALRCLKATVEGGVDRLRHCPFRIRLFLDQTRVQP